MFKAMQNIEPSHMLYQTFFDFTSISSGTHFEGDGSKGFEPPELNNPRKE